MAPPLIRDALTSSDRVGVVPLADALGVGPSVWDGLLQGGPSPSPFMSWAWHRAWAEAAQPHELESSRTLMVRSESGAVEAVLPFRLYRTRFRRMPVTALGWAIGDLGCPDHLELPALGHARVDTFVPHLERLPCDVMLLSNVAEVSPNMDRLLAACVRRGWSVRRAPMWRCPYLELPSSWDAYLASLSRHRRQLIKRTERNLYRGHEVVVRQYGSAHLEEGLRHLCQLHAQRWDGGGVFALPAMTRLHAAFASLLAQRGQLWLATLDLDGTPAAAWYGFLFGDTIYFYQGGWDPTWHHESVGAVLMGIMIRRAIDGGFRRFDFLRGDEPYKMSWTRSWRACYEVALIKPGPRGAILSGLDWAARHLTRARRGKTGSSGPVAS